MQAHVFLQLFTTQNCNTKSVMVSTANKWQLTTALYKTTIWRKNVHIEEVVFIMIHNCYIICSLQITSAGVIWCCVGAHAQTTLFCWPRARDGNVRTRTTAAKIWRQHLRRKSRRSRQYATVSVSATSHDDSASSGLERLCATVRRRPIYDDIVDKRQW